MSLHRGTFLSSALPLLIIACGPPQQVATPAPDRVTAVLDDGTIWRQSTADENSAFTVTASPDSLWAALTNSYSELGIIPTLNDRPGLRYGNAGFIMPRMFAEHRVGEFFDCGQGATGARVDEGRVFASVMSTAAPAGNGSVRVSTRITGTWRSNEGASKGAVTCSSTGRLETTLRAGVERRLLAKR
jgi:hypothetical protein